MRRAEGDELQKRKNETSLKTMYFNRFLLIRYITAGFFFINLYWFCSSMMSNKIGAIIPGISLIVIVRAVWEQCTMYSEPIDNAKKTIFAYKFIFVMNIVVIGVMFTPLFDKTFPFLVKSTRTYGFILGIIFVGMILCVLMLRKLERIKNRTDRQIKNIRRFEKAIR